MDCLFIGISILLVNSFFEKNVGLLEKISLHFSTQTLEILCLETLSINAAFQSWSLFSTTNFSTSNNFFFKKNSFWPTKWKCQCTNGPSIKLGLNFDLSAATYYCGQFRLVGLIFFGFLDRVFFLEFCDEMKRDLKVTKVATVLEDKKMCK